MRALETAGPGMSPALYPHPLLDTVEALYDYLDLEGALALSRSLGFYNQMVRPRIETEKRLAPTLTPPDKVLAATCAPGCVSHRSWARPRRPPGTSKTTLH